MGHTRVVKAEFRTLNVVSLHVCVSERVFCMRTRRVCVRCGVFVCYALEHTI